jgi:hypothetical protein
MSYATNAALVRITASHSGYLEFETFFGEKLTKETFLWSFSLLRDKLREYPRLKVSVFLDTTPCLLIATCFILVSFLAYS